MGSGITVDLLLGDEEFHFSPEYMEEEDSGSESEEDPSGTLPEGDRVHTTQLVQNVVVRDMVNKAILLQKERIRLLHMQAEIVKRGHPAAAGPSSPSLGCLRGA
jgi:hypothetical protein